MPTHRTQAREKAIDALRESEEQFRAVFDSALDAMVIVDDEGRYVDVNPAACELFGRTRDELLSLSFAGDLVRTPSAGELAVWRSFSTGAPLAGTTTIVRRDGTHREVEFTATANVLPGRHLSILRDVTERKQLETALWQAQKLESVGALAGGIAHDFNNMLTAIRGYSQLLLARLAPGTAEHRHAEEIERAADRAAKLHPSCWRSGADRCCSRALDLNALVTDLSPMLLRILGPEVVLEVDSAGDLREVRADPAQMEQVILNIVANASEECPSGAASRSGRATSTSSTTWRLPTGPPPASSPAEVRTSSSRSATRGRAWTQRRSSTFEPFFTTKEVGLGDGLGLSTAYGIVKQSGGTIVAESRFGSGATFRIFLPALV